MGKFLSVFNCLLDLAKRYGNHEIMMMFNSAGSPNTTTSSFLTMDSHSSLGSALGSMRKTKYALSLLIVNVEMPFSSRGAMGRP